MQRVVCERLTSLNVALLGFICVAAVSAFHFFSVPNSLPPRGRTAFTSGTFGGSPAWSVWLLLLRSFVHTFLCGHLFPFLLLTAAGAEPSSPRAALRTCRAVRGVPSSACGSGLSTPSPTLVIFFSLYLLRTKWCPVVLVFISLPTDDVENLHCSLAILCIFGKMSIHFLRLFFDWVIFLSITEL